MKALVEGDQQEDLNYQNIEQAKQQKAVLPPISKSHSARVDYIPKHLLISLTQNGKGFEDLGPGTKRNATRRPANIWNHEKQREKFKHLIDQPACYCGAGQDISYLLDNTQVQSDISKEKKYENKNKNEKRSLEEHSKNHIPETIIPSEFHVVKHKGVVAIDIQDDKYMTAPSQHEKHLTVFPSMKPAGRQEALQLMQTMNSLLEKAGVQKDVNTGFKKCPESGKQIEELLSLVKQEQKIYNIIFHEVIRQVSIECVERGNILAELRIRYAKILDRVPKQVKSLHEEVIAQRALDRRLTEELGRFKTSITLLTKELHEVHAHDEEVTRQAVQTQLELNEALRESEKNASLLAEYHDLYELQRRRLDYQLSKLIEERDLWAGSAHMLSLKVTSKHSLVTVRRLHLFEKTWYKLVNRFALLLGQDDQEKLQILTNHVQEWQNVSFSFNEKLCDAEKQTCIKLREVLIKLNDWSDKFESVVTPDEGTVHPLEGNDIKNLFEVLKSWEEFFNNEAERFTGDTLLSCEDDLLQLNTCIDEWIEVSLKVFANHPMQDGTIHPQHLAMIELNKTVMRLHNCFQLRMSGENGIARGVINMINTLDTWVNKLNVLLNGGETLFDSEWIQLADFMQVQWKDNIKSLIRILSFTNDGDMFNDKLISASQGSPQESWACLVTDVNQAVDTTQKWLDSTVDAFQMENSNVVEQIDTTHSNMIRWMVTVLIRIAPNMQNTDVPDNVADEDDTKGLGASILMESTPPAILDRATVLFNWVRSLTDLIGSCCRNIVIASTQDENENEINKEDNMGDLKKIEIECQGWMNTANLILDDVCNKSIPIEEFKAVNLNLPKTSSTLNRQDGSPTENCEPITMNDMGATKEVDDGEVLVSTDQQQVTTVTEEVVKCENDLQNEDAGVSQKTDEMISPEDTYDTQMHVYGPGESSDTQIHTIGPDESSDSQMHVIGPDENVRKQPMVLNDEASERLSASSRKDTLISSMSLEALTTLENLQEQLLKTEERAQSAESRAFHAESLLKEAQERIRALERSMSRSGITPFVDTPLSTPTNKKRSLINNVDTNAAVTSDGIKEVPEENS